MIIDNELLAAYAEGNVSPQEREAVRQYLAENPDMMESVLFAMEEGDLGDYVRNLDRMVDEIENDVHKPLTIDSQPSILPMTAMAAQNTIDNLCVIRCEGFALRTLGFDVTDQQLLEESQQHGWLLPQETALHNIGRLSGLRGLSVSHRYHCTIHDIQDELSSGNIVIAALDGNELTGDFLDEKRKDGEIGLTPNHAVIVQSISEDSVSILDPAVNTSALNLQPTTFPVSQFLDAWDDSSNYLIVISNGDLYIPHPINLDDVIVEDELIELREAIAENAHEVWAETRRNEGWTYGPERDDVRKQHPDMLPYNRLPESEKEYDRIMAMNTIKLVKKLGWELTKSKKK